MHDSTHNQQDDQPEVLIVQGFRSMEKTFCPKAAKRDRVYEVNNDLSSFYDHGRILCRDSELTRSKDRYCQIMRCQSLEFYKSVFSTACQRHIFACGL